MKHSSNQPGPKGPGHFILGYVTLHLDESAVSVNGATPKFGPAHQQIVAPLTTQSARDAQARLDETRRTIFLSRDLAIIAHTDKHGG